MRRLAPRAFFAPPRAARLQAGWADAPDPPGALSQRQTRFLLLQSKSEPAGIRPETASGGDAGTQAER
ncbi:hypothetical protein AAY473_005355 [Plecturocebus cupreus]